MAGRLAPLLALALALAEAKPLVLPKLIALAPLASPSEKAAAERLKTQLGLAGLAASVVLPKQAKGKHHIAVGYMAAIDAGVPKSQLDSLPGNDSFALLCRSGSVMVASAAASMRGTLMAVNRLLTEAGFDFLAPDETILPQPPISIDDTMALTFVPTFENRDGNAWPAGHNAEWAGLLGYNGAGAHGPAGGSVQYANPPGFVHTSYNLLAGESGYDVSKCTRADQGPCKDVYDAHPEWFWPKNDPSTCGQLCWTEPMLIDKLKAVVRDILSKSPDATIISVSQNDNGNYCKSDAEAAVIAEEGSPMGPLLRAVNAIADDIAHDFPHVAIDTLAYQYTRPAPTKTKPRPNVIVRLCSIECNFGLPLSDPSNAAFQKDMNGWAAISNRTYIWDYVTNFQAYLQPFPNYYVLGPNIKYLAAHGVRGMFEEGSYTTPGGDMEVLKDYVMGRMLTDPSLDSDQLVFNFVKGYYGPAAASVQYYIDTFHKAVLETQYFMHESFDHTAPFLKPQYLVDTKQHLDGGEMLVAGSRFAARVQAVKLAVQYVVLLRWEEISGYASQQGLAWPFAKAKADEFTAFSSTATTVGVKGVWEGGCDLACFYKRVFPSAPVGFIV